MTWRRHRSGTGAAISGLCCLMLLSGLPLAAAADLSSAGATISGEVVDSHGRGIGEICVVVWDGLPREREPVGLTVTDERGAYTLTDVPAGEVRLFYFDCYDEPTFEYVWWRNSGTYSEAEPIDLASGSNHVGYDVVLGDGSSIAGHVRAAATGSGLDEVCIGLFDEDLLLIDVVLTDAAGEYTLPALRTNDYRVVFVDCADEPQYAAQWWDHHTTFERSDVIPLPSVTDLTDVNASLVIAGRITGTVTSQATGVPVDEACVGVFDDEGDLLSAAYTGEDGRYLIEGIFPGTYRAAFVDCANVPRYEIQWYGGGDSYEDAVPVTVTEGATTSGIDAALPSSEWQGADPQDPATWGTPDDGPTSPSGIDRWAGSSRVQTAVRISEETFDPGVPVVYVATGANYPDALAGGPPAVREGGPMLLVDRRSIPPSTAAELSRLSAERIVVLGGTGVISDAVMNDLRNYTTGTVTRLSGEDRYETAAAISAASFDRDVPVVYIATGRNYPDALSGGVAAAMEDGPILLTEPNSLPWATSAELIRLQPERIRILGGRTAVSEQVRAELEAYTSNPVVRLAGQNRYGTAAKVAERFDAAQTVFVATGQNFPDALAGVPAAGLRGAPLLLVTATAIPEETAVQLDRLMPEHIVILGERSVVSQQVEDGLARYLSNTSVPPVAPPSLSAGPPSDLDHGPAGPPALETGSLKGKGFPGQVATAAPPTHMGSGGYVLRSRGMWGDFDLLCGGSWSGRTVSGAAPVVVNARRGSYVWWRQQAYWYNGRTFVHVANGPWHYSTAGDNYMGGTTTHANRWIPHGLSTITSRGYVSVSNPGWYALRDELYFDGHYAYSLAINYAGTARNLCHIP